MIRWWPPFGLAAMVLLGGAVRHGTTPIDTWFGHLGRELGPRRAVFLWFTEPWLVACVLLAVIVVAMYRRQWWFAAAAAAIPPVAVLLAQVLKRVFVRYKGTGLAYPSGHTTFLVATLCLLVVAAGFALWAVAAATVLAALGMFGQAITHHYFTDTVGAALLATSLATVAVVALDRCQPRCDVRHKP
ncbi:PA-phosphatase [Mycolicibacterium goodii]|uniref:PA-phosphatase n=1 Tax=Mycolicibacterium goodii TaxID=134601 RepID=A0A0K0X049_MYCGD|nr:PA-phosphatase [Mycolicibacterium goodii]